MGNSLIVLGLVVALLWVSMTAKISEYISSRSWFDNTKPRHHIVLLILSGPLMWIFFPLFVFSDSRKDPSKKKGKW